MGAHEWWYFVPYQPNIQKALDALREREFQAGRYNPVIPFPKFPISGDYPGPGAKHSSIQQALEASDADGTRSILDIERVSTEPDYGAVTQLSSDAIYELYDTDQPSRDMILRNMGFFEGLERGQGIYMIIYRDGNPSELFFAGYSFD